MRPSIVRISALLSLLYGTVSGSVAPKENDSNASAVKDARVIILGGGVAGVIAARTLKDQGIENFVIVEAQDQLGGRLKSHRFGVEGRQYTIELGANWIQGTQEGNGPENPILTLAKKHQLKTHFNDWFGSITTYDLTGPVDYLDVFDSSGDNYTTLTVAAGARVSKGLVDTTARTGYSLIGAKSKSPHAMASEYYQFDWEYAQTPEESSWIASSWGNNFTYNTDDGGFSDDNLMSIDQRGFKELIQAEADEFLRPGQVLLNSTVEEINYSASGVQVTMRNGTKLEADYVLCTFSLGVLQNDDVRWQPLLPEWKQEAIQSMTMATYTKIFFQFPENFWFDTEMGLYADTERGKYPVWQSLDHVNFLPGSGILFVTVTGDYSARIESLSDDQVQTEVMDVIRKMFPDVDIPNPVAFYFPRWRSDKLFRGSYSNWPSSFFSDHHRNLRATVSERLWFAGEATSFKYFGFLHGAYFEGMEVAQAMSVCIQSGDCTELPHVAEVTIAHS